MPKFRVLRRVDAWIDSVAEVEAMDASAAAEAAYRHPARLHRSQTGVEEFANTLFVTLDPEGEELSETAFMRG